jgi:hypothetical protein
MIDENISKIKLIKEVNCKQKILSMNKSPIK